MDRDPAVAAMLVKVDRMRMEPFEQKFARLTGNAKTAGALASLFYLAIVGGHQALSRPLNPPQTREYIKAIISTYLIQQ